MSAVSPRLRQGIDRHQRAGGSFLAAIAISEPEMLVWLKNTAGWGESVEEPSVTQENDEDEKERRRKQQRREQAQRRYARKAKAAAVEEGREWELSTRAGRKREPVVYDLTASPRKQQCVDARAVDEPVHEPVHEPVDEPVDELVDEPDEPVDVATVAAKTLTSTEKMLQTREKKRAEAKALAAKRKSQVDPCLRKVGPCGNLVDPTHPAGTRRVPARSRRAPRQFDPDPDGQHLRRMTQLAQKARLLNEHKRVSKRYAEAMTKAKEDEAAARAHAAKSLTRVEQARIEKARLRSVTHLYPASLNPLGSKYAQRVLRHIAEVERKGSRVTHADVAYVWSMPIWRGRDTGDTSGRYGPRGGSTQYELRCVHGCGKRMCLEGDSDLEQISNCHGTPVSDTSGRYGPCQRQDWTHPRNGIRNLFPGCQRCNSKCGEQDLFDYVRKLKDSRAITLRQTLAWKVMHCLHVSWALEQ